MNRWHFTLKLHEWIDGVFVHILACRYYNNLNGLMAFLLNIIISVTEASVLQSIPHFLLYSLYQFLITLTAIVTIHILHTEPFEN